MILSPLIVQISQFCFIAGNGIAYGNGCFSPYMLFFLIGMRHWKILTCLRMDGFQISMSTLRRRLKLLGLFRRKAQSDLREVAPFLQEQLNQYGMLHGYRFMHLKCIQAGLVVTRCSLSAQDSRSSRSTAEVKMASKTTSVQKPRPELLVAGGLLRQASTIWYMH